MNIINRIIPLPDAIAVGREKSVFAEDIENNAAQLTDSIKGSRILVIGGAGSIGSSTIETLSSFKPAALHVVDQNENGLAELVVSHLSIIFEIQSRLIMF